MSTTGEDDLYATKLQQLEKFGIPCLVKNAKKMFRSEKEDSMYTQKLNEMRAKGMHPQIIKNAEDMFYRPVKKLKESLCANDDFADDYYLRSRRKCDESQANKSTQHLLENANSSISSDDMLNGEYC